jgi:hypothetical protein
LNDVDARGKSGPRARTASDAGTPRVEEGTPVFREPGWYRDPEEPRWHRYWDGNAWLPYRPTLDRAATREGDPTPAEDLPRPRRHNH